MKKKNPIPQLEDGRIDTRALGMNKEPEPLGAAEDRCDCERCKEIWSKPVEYPLPVVPKRRARALPAREVRRSKKKTQKRARKKNRR